MFGLMTAVKAAEAIIVTTGKFTRDAQEFAVGKPIQLIDGPHLLTLVQSVQTHSGATAALFSPSTLRREGRREVNNSGLRSQVSGLETAHTCCPSCGLPTVLRTSKRGANAGTRFWGCSTYPTCKGTRKA
jgi:restriction system protein